MGAFELNRMEHGTEISSCEHTKKVIGNGKVKLWTFYGYYLGLRFIWMTSLSVDEQK